MRDIKCRCWNKVTKEMEYIFNPVCHGELNILKLSKVIHGWGDYERVIMQFTGLCDKNGKEIYDKDIIKIDYTPDMENAEEDIVVTDVEWLEDDITCGWSIDPATCWHAEVIGNIYENPELFGGEGMKDKLKEIGFYTLENKRALNVSLASPLWRCELLLTSKCNFKCPYCRGTDISADITLSYAKYVIDLWAKEGLKNIRFSGGEPTCVTWLEDIVEYSKMKNIQRIAISTNGSDKLERYKNLIKLGANDYSISLDACCSSFGDRMSGVKGSWNRVVENIRELSKLTYVTVGCVFDENNVEQSLETILFAHDLGVADIRIISSAQYNKALENLNIIPKKILNSHPILKYRVKNFLNGRNVRGIKKTDNHKCPLILDDMAIKGNYHYPCIIKLREGCKPIGLVSKFMRIDRGNYYLQHNVYQDKICRENCLDVCIDYNNKHREYRGYP